MEITMAKLRMAHASTHGARKPPGPILSNKLVTAEKEVDITVGRKTKAVTDEK